MQWIPRESGVWGVRPLSWSLILEDVGAFMMDAAGQRDFGKDQLLALLG